MKYFQLFAFIILGQSLLSQAQIREEKISLLTYPFDHPNPLPIVLDNPKIVPYHKFQGYTQKGVMKAWKTVVLENEYIKLWVLPEIGGKVWGAIEKGSNEEFIYRNEVIKFRNIAMRGPWTSGGIEFNFGIIGHHPSTASPVDYVTRTNGDGSVSCIVGSMDLPSDTYWRVEIRLEEDKAYFETKASWYNASDLPQAYYNWMTAAAVASADHEFVIPGHYHLAHDGQAHPWPIDEQGRDLSFYPNNDFGGSKSYHVVGSLDNFFGGYYHEKDMGYGHWALYEEMPGQKLWLWDLSRNGGIWEDLLTDTDGQYIEFQAGRLFNQYQPRDGHENPIGQTDFDPMTYDHWSELWFPVKAIGGMTTVDKKLVFNIEIKENGTYVGVNALAPIQDTIRIWNGVQLVYESYLRLNPLEVFDTTLQAITDDMLQVEIGTYFRHGGPSEETKLARNFKASKIALSEEERLIKVIKDALAYREFSRAEDSLEFLLAIDPHHSEGLALNAQLSYRMADYHKAKECAQSILNIATYDSRGNYWLGLSFRALGDKINALESLGWAARDIKYRSPAFTIMAEIYLADGDYEKSIYYANKALEYGSKNLRALHTAIVANRVVGAKEKAKGLAKETLIVDPLDHFVVNELALLEQNDGGGLEIHNEYPDQTLLNLAIAYRRIGLVDDAIDVLERIENPSILICLWRAYLLEDDRSIEYCLDGDVEFVFPYRKETLDMIRWASDKTDHWKLTYLKAHNLLALGQAAQAKSIITDEELSADSPIYHLFRAKVLRERGYSLKTCYEKAIELDSSESIWWEEYITFLLNEDKITLAYDASCRALTRFEHQYELEFLKSKCELKLGKYEDCIQTLDQMQLLPFEGASESRKIYELAHFYQALQLLEEKKFKQASTVLNKSKQWPENIGVGRPHKPDERVANFLLGLIELKQGYYNQAEPYFRQVVEHNSRRQGALDQLKDWANLKLKNTDGHAELVGKGNEDMDSLLKRIYNLVKE